MATDAAHRMDVALPRETSRGKNRCTAIDDLLARAAQTPSDAAIAIIVSDGVETCKPKPRLPIPAPPASAHVVLVLISSKAAPHRGGLSDAEIYSMRSLALLHVAPWLSIIAPWQVPTALPTILSTAPAP